MVTCGSPSLRTPELFVLTGHIRLQMRAASTTVLVFKLVFVQPICEICFVIARSASYRNKIQQGLQRKLSQGDNKFRGCGCLSVIVIVTVIVVILVEGDGMLMLMLVALALALELVLEVLLFLWWIATS